MINKYVFILSVPLGLSQTKSFFRSSVLSETHLGELPCSDDIRTVKTMALGMAILRPERKVSNLVLNHLKRRKEKKN